MGNSNNVVILATGGTIAGTAAHASQAVGYTAAQLGVEQLLAAVPDLAQVAGGGLLAEQVAQLDSKDMDNATWVALAQRGAHWLARDDVRALVITHGTDTLEETAWFLAQVLPRTGKPVVLTCAMRPATALLAVTAGVGSAGSATDAAGTVGRAGFLPYIGEFGSQFLLRWASTASWSTVRGPVLFRKGTGTLVT